MTVKKELQEKLTFAIRSDPKRSGILGVLVLVLVVIWVKMLVTSPSRTGVSSAAAASVATTDKDAISFSVPQSRSTRADTLAGFIAQPITVAERDIFAVNLNYFEAEAQATPAPEKIKPSGNFWDSFAKSVQTQADERVRRANLVQNMRRQAEALKLQSIVMGANPKAMINGELLGEGGVVAEFRVLKIEARRVVIEREGVKLEITIN